MLYLEQS